MEEEPKTIEDLAIGFVKEQHSVLYQEKIHDLYLDIVNRVSKQSGKESKKISYGSNFYDNLGMDSLDLVELVMEFEDKYEMEVPDGTAENFKTVYDIVYYVLSKHTELGDEQAAKLMNTNFTQVSQIYQRAREIGKQIFGEDKALEPNTNLAEYDLDKCNKFAQQLISEGIIKDKETADNLARTTLYDITKHVAEQTITL